MNDLPDWSRAWKENGRSRTRRFREEAYAWNYGERHSVKAFPSNVKAHQIAPTTEKALNNQVDRMM